MKTYRLFLLRIMVVLLPSCSTPFWDWSDNDNVSDDFNETSVERPKSFEEEVYLINKFVEIKDNQYVLDESTESFQDMNFNYSNVLILKERLNQLNGLIQKDLGRGAYVYMFDQYGESKLISNDGNLDNGNNIHFEFLENEPVLTRSTVYKSISGNMEARLTTPGNSVTSKGQITTNQAGFLYGWLTCETGYYGGSTKNTQIVFTSPYSTYRNINMSWKSNSTTSPYNWTFFFGVGGNNSGSMTFLN